MCVPVHVCVCVCVCVYVCMCVCMCPQENNTVYALTHMEWDCKNAVECPFYGRTPPLTFFSAVTLMMSLDGGRSLTHTHTHT